MNKIETIWIMDGSTVLDWDLLNTLTKDRLGKYLRSKRHYKYAVIDLCKNHQNCNPEDIPQYVTLCKFIDKGYKIYNKL